MIKTESGYRVDKFGTDQADEVEKFCLESALREVGYEYAKHNAQMTVEWEAWNGPTPMVFNTKKKAQQAVNDGRAVYVTKLVTVILWSEK